LFGAGSAANTAGGYYQNAANQIATEYGSPAAGIFSKEEMAALRPLFTQENSALGATLAAQGLSNSGAGRALGGNLAATQSGQLAGAVAPLYQQGLADYAGIISQMPGAQNTAYQNAISQGMQALGAAGSAFGLGIPGIGGGAAPLNFGMAGSSDPYAALPSAPTQAPMPPYNPSDYYTSQGY
jgi:hypothetical protein